ncbi:MAG: translation initiation factor [Endozoicomonas sp. (ex Botrylloides leachii)]|nr:translation initiation factor [Endozoicomonas sp. (ex Botrylloides leachii)]
MPKCESNSRLVYRTDQGRVRDDNKKEEIVGDGNVRIRPEKKGRGGKVVTVISGLPLSGNELKALAKQLKKRCGGGGSVKQGNIELQGNHVDNMIDALIDEGYNVKRSGG